MRGAGIGANLELVGPLLAELNGIETARAKGGVGRQRTEAELRRDRGDQGMAVRRANAQKLIAAGRTEEGLAKLQQAARDNPNNAQALSTYVGAREAYVIEPGHDAWVVGNETVVMVDFQGMVDYARRS